MEDTRMSDLSNTQLDLVDMSENPVTAIEDDSQLSQNSAGGRGFCVKEYEEHLQSLRKENFNLKLRIYFLEEKNPNIPEGAETLYKQNIDLKIEKENLLKEVQEKQDLLCEASKALNLLDTEKSSDLKKSQMKIEELQQKIEAMDFEILSLQNVIADANKSIGNDTGFTDFLGAVDNRDIEMQRKVMELNELVVSLTTQCNNSEEKCKEIQNQKSNLESQLSNLLYENDELKDKVSEFEKKSREQNTKLEADLKDFKEKWASAQCDLQDTEQKLSEVERERDRALNLLQTAMENLEKERIKTNELENIIASSGNTKESSKTDRNKLLMKDDEILRLKEELSFSKRQVQTVVNQEMKEKNAEIAKLNGLLKNLSISRSSIGSGARFSLEQLSDSFNDLKFQQAMEVKKESQQLIDRLISELFKTVTDKKSHQHVQKLQQQMAIVVEKQEMTDSALGKCAELCSYTLDHLNELATFLKALLQQKEIRESLSEMTMCNIQSVLDKTLDMTHHSSRFSVEPASSLPDISSLDILMTTARNSLACMKEISNSSKSMQVCDESHFEAMQEELEEVKSELEAVKNELEAARIELEKGKKQFKKSEEVFKEAVVELTNTKQVNQVLEDEICQLKSNIEDYKRKIKERNEKLLEISIAKSDAVSKLYETEDSVRSLQNKCDELELKLQNETVKKLEFENQSNRWETKAGRLQDKLEALQKDFEANWIPKRKHEDEVKRLEHEIVNGEAELAAIRMEFDSFRDQIEAEAAKIAEEAPENKENTNLPVPTPRRTLEISEDRKRLLMSDIESSSAAVPGSGDTTCVNCPKYQAKILELKKYLARAVEKIRLQGELKVQNERVIQKQLSNTEKFLQSARSNMENILKTKESNKE